MLTPEERAELEAVHQHRLTVPRRPAWTMDMTSEALDAQERASFLDWRRSIAVAENETGLTVTPFEKNLEVWRQLWRVLERSDVIVQVIDARNPLFYFCDDLATYGAEFDPPKRTAVLLNKADLLTRNQRQAWARHFRAKDVPFFFFSAKREAPGPAAEAERELMRQRAAKEAEGGPGAGAGAHDGAAGDGADGGEEDTRVCTRNELIASLEILAQTAYEEAMSAQASAQTPPPGDGGGGPRSRLPRMGLVGYPNVGKSSTINALKGEKKTVVSSTPGKTKHFQTLHVSPTLVLCDCPGLVFPRFAESRAFMTCSGVLPIDKISQTVRGPLNLIASQFPRAYLNHLYGIRLLPEEGRGGGGQGGEGGGREGGHAEGEDRVSGRQLAEALALRRGHVLYGGRPDEMKGGRRVLKDYVDGKLCFCHAPPDALHPEEFEVKAPPPEECGAGGAAEGGPGGPRTYEGEDTHNAPSLEGVAGGGLGHNARAGPRRPDYKFNKKRGGKNKKKAIGGHVNADGGMAIGRKGGVIGFT